MDSDVVTVTWFEHDCPWVTKYCDENHVKVAKVPRTVLMQYAFPPDGHPIDDEMAATAYWSEVIRPELGDLPVPGLRHLRDRYVLDVIGNETALAELREWWRTR